MMKAERPSEGHFLLWLRAVTSLDLRGQRNHRLASAQASAARRSALGLLLALRLRAGNTVIRGSGESDLTEKPGTHWPCSRALPGQRSAAKPGTPRYPCSPRWGRYRCE